MVSFGNIFRDLTQFARDAAPFAAGVGAFRGAPAATSTFDRGLQALQAAAAAAPQQVSAPRAMPSETGQSVAVSISDTPPRETAMSGEFRPMNAAYMRPPSTSGMGGIMPAGGPLAIIPPAVSAGRGVLGMLGLAGGAITVAPFIIDPITGQEKKLRVTRRLKSNVKKAVEMFGVEFVAEQMGTSIDVIFYILTKRMRNDGPAITKAALRKTRSTMRKLDAMCDMRDKMRPPARRATRARTTSKVMQIKN